MVAAGTAGGIFHPEQSLCLTIRQDLATRGWACRALERFAVSTGDLPHPGVAISCARQKDVGLRVPLHPLGRGQSASQRSHTPCHPAESRLPGHKLHTSLGVPTLTSKSPTSKDHTSSLASTRHTLISPDMSPVATKTESWLKPAQVTESLCPRDVRRQRLLRPSCGGQPGAQRQQNTG